MTEPRECWVNVVDAPGGPLALRLYSAPWPSQDVANLALKDTKLQGLLRPLYRLHIRLKD